MAAATHPALDKALNSALNAVLPVPSGLVLGGRSPGLVSWLEMTAQPLFQFGTVALDPAPDWGSRNNGTKTHAKPRPRSVSWWLLALKEQSPGGSVRDLSLSRDGPNRHIGVLRAELSHLPPRSIVQTRTSNVLPPRFVLSPFRLSHDPIAECPPGSPAQRVVR